MIQRTKLSRRAFVIAPRKKDAKWPQKRNLLGDTADKLGWILTIPKYSNATSTDCEQQHQDAIRSADLVLADLSFERPSSYYELGFAEALGKSIAIIAQKGTEIHQTSNRDRTIEYETLEDYRRAIIQILK